MDDNKTDRINQRAYALWEAEGRPDGRHHDHWVAAEREIDAPEGQSGETAHGTAGTDPHPGMMGDGTEEQNLGQPGNPDARITEGEVRDAFSEAGESKGETAGSEG